MATGTVSGVIPARGSSLKKNAALAPASASTSTSHAAAAVSCGTEPDCNLPYGGGPVQHTPHVYLVFWGPKWGTSTYTATENFVKSFFTDLGQPSDYWSTTVEQYGDKTGHPTFGKGLLVSTYWDKNTPEKSVNNTNLGTEAAAAVNWLHITDTNDANVVIAAQQGTCFAASGGVTFAGNCGTPQASGYCAFHDWDVNTANSSLHLPWVNLPYQPDAGVGCGQTFINTPGTDDGYSITGGHELMEAITDPIGTGWVDNADTTSGGEVADKCAWGGQLWGDSDPYGNVKIGPGTFAMQSLWSNAVTGCVMNGGLPLSVTTPATQTATTGKAVSLKITASIGGAQHAFDVHGVRAARRAVDQQVHRRDQRHPQRHGGHVHVQGHSRLLRRLAHDHLRLAGELSHRGDEGVRLQVPRRLQRQDHRGQQDRHLDLHRRRRAEHHLRGEHASCSWSVNASRARRPRSSGSAQGPPARNGRGSPTASTC